MHNRKDTLVETLARLESVTEQYGDVVRNEAADARQDCGVIASEKLMERFAALAGENRLLVIGIIGRVKAGKSSLLNSIFFGGKSVLPEAATPMTASLTILTYGDEFSASVEYFTGQDIEGIRREHGEYKSAWEQTFAEKKKELEEKAAKKGERAAPSEIEAQAKRQADKALKEGRKFASFDQYERMKKSERGGFSSPAEASRRIGASTLDELMEKLSDYVGSEGKFMPFTKSVEVRLREDALQNIQVVDTPGINDPVISREARTAEYLGKCDVVFVISPAGQFISSEDMELMDRLSSKEGVRELYLIASQADNQLYGSVGEAAGWNLHRALKEIRSALTTQAVRILKDLKERHPEVGSQFDQLINEGGERVMVTSALCHAMSLRFDERGAWDSGMKHVWGLLSDSYLDYFGADETAKANLGSLGGIAAVADKIDAARRKKDEIIARKEADYLAGQEAIAENFKERLIRGVSEKIELVRTSDIQKVRAEKKSLTQLVLAGGEAIDGTFEDCVDDFKSALREAVANGARTLFAEAGNDVSNAEKSETRTRHWTTGLIWKKYHSENYEVLTIRTGAVRNILGELLGELEGNLVTAVENAKKEWRRAVQSQVTRALREAAGDMEIDFTTLKNALRRQVNSMELPEFSLSGHGFSFAEAESRESKGFLWFAGSRSRSGTLESDEAEEFINEVNEYIGRLKRVYTQKTGQFIADVEKSVKREKISDLMFKDMKGRLEALEKEIENKQMTLDRLDRCLSALKGAE
jgi:hypothetical protein